MNNNLETKFFEIRDRGTFVPALAVKMLSHDLKEQYLLNRAGYSITSICILLIMIETSKCAYDPYNWNGSRTMTIAHEHIRRHFNELETGTVIDVQFILGETKEPKKSEGLYE